MSASRPQTGTVEERSAPEALSVEGKKLRGSIPYNVESRDLGGWKEIISPGALRGADLSDLVATVDHGGVPIGRHPGTLTVEDGAEAFRWSVELPASRSDVREAVERGDLRATSWRMVVGRDRWDGDTRHVEEIRALRDVSVVTLPAYPAATAELRSAPAPEGEPSHTPEPEEAPVMPDEPTKGGGLTVEARSAPETRAAEKPADIETRVLEAIKSVRPGESRSLTTLSASPIDTPELATYVWDKLYPESVMLQAGIRTLTTSRESLVFPHLTSAVNPSWTAEGVEIPEGDPTWEQITVTPSKLAHRVVATNEALDDAPIDLLGWLQAHVMRVLGLKLDAGLLEGHPTGGAPGVTGLKYASGITTVDVMGANGGPLTDLDPIAEAVAAVEQANARPSAIIMPPELWFAAETLKDSNHRYILSPGQDPTQAPSRSLFGLPVFTSSQLSTTESKGTSTSTCSVYVLDASQVVLVRRADVQIEIDRAQFFSSDMTQLRAKLRAGFVIPNGQAVARVTGVQVG